MATWIDTNVLSAMRSGDQAAQDEARSALKEALVYGRLYIYQPAFTPNSLQAPE
jgi:hypothetical protein